MISLYIPASGLLAGAIHVFTGPDHLAAVAPLTVGRRRGGWRIGLWWGIGHSAGVWILAILALLLREVLPLAWLSQWSERLVGVVLIAIGLWGMRKALATRVHTHEHEHDGTRHRHIHVHSADAQHDPRRSATPHAHTHGALAVGALHGLAGTSHLLGVLPTLLMPSRLDAAAYVIAFAAGSIAGMIVFAWLIGLVVTRWVGFETRGYRSLMLSCGGAAVIVGGIWLFRTGILHGVLRSGG